MIFLTNLTLWRELANLISLFPLDGPRDQRAFMEQQMRAVTLLRQGYRENLDLLCATNPLGPDPTVVGHLYIGDFNNRALICFTSREIGNRCSASMGPFRVDTLPCRFVLGNMMNKSVIQGLVFDPKFGQGSGMVVSKEFFRMFNLTGDPDYPAPDSFVDPGRQGGSAGTPGNRPGSKKRKKKKR